MYATNMEYFGHLINPDSFNTSKIRPEMFEIQTNFDVKTLKTKFTYQNKIYKSINSRIGRPVILDPITMTMQMENQWRYKYIFKLTKKYSTNF